MHLLNWPRAIFIATVGLTLALAMLPAVRDLADKWTAFIQGTPLDSGVGTAALLTFAGLPLLLLGLGYILMVCANAWPKR